MKKFRRVEVLWRDTSGKNGWCDDLDVQEKLNEPDYVSTVGYLLEKTRDKLIIASGESCWGTYMNLLSIPRNCVIGMNELQIAKNEK